RPGHGLRGVAALSVLVAAPQLVAPASWSDDVYLYLANARAGAVYGVNPYTTPPSSVGRCSAGEAKVCRGPADCGAGTCERDPVASLSPWALQPMAYGPL